MDLIVGLLTGTIKTVNEDQWAKRSYDKCLKYFGNNNDNSLGEERLAKVLVVSAVIANVGKILCKSCYY